MTLFTAGKSGEDPLRCWNRWTKFVAQFNFIHSASKFFLFLIAYGAMNIRFELAILYRIAKSCTS